MLFYFHQFLYTWHKVMLVRLQGNIVVENNQDLFQVTFMNYLVTPHRSLYFSIPPMCLIQKTGKIVSALYLPPPKTEKMIQSLGDSEYLWEKWKAVIFVILFPSCSFFYFSFFLFWSLPKTVFHNMFLLSKAGKTSSLENKST